MDQAQRIQRINDIISDKLGVPLERITPDAEFDLDFGVSTLEVSEVLLAITHDPDFDGIEFSPEEIAQLERVQQLYELVSEKLEF